MEFVRGEDGGILVLLTLCHVGAGCKNGYNIHNMIGGLGGHVDKRLFEDQNWRKGVLEDLICVVEVDQFHQEGEFMGEWF